MKLLRRLMPNPLDRMIKTWKKAKARSILIPWNRGLGDLPIALYAVIERIHGSIPEAEITFLTRLDLEAGFSLIPSVKAVVDPQMQRGKPFHLDPGWVSSFDARLDSIDVDRWLDWQIGKIKPRLIWDPAWDAKSAEFHLEGSYIGIHFQSDTDQFYGRPKNLPVHRMMEIVQEIAVSLGKKVVLFGGTSGSSIDVPNITLGKCKGGGFKT